MSNCPLLGNLAPCSAKFATTGLSEVPGNSVVDTNDVKGCPGEAGRDDDPRGGLRAAARGRVWGDLSSCSLSPPERKSPSDNATRPDAGGTERETLATRFAPGADACGALGCRSGGSLFRLEGDLLERVLCATHLEEFVRQAGTTSKAAETLRSARSGVPGPSGEAAATGDRREPNERRCGRGCGAGGGAE